MHHAPLLSTITLVTELVVTTSILYVFYSAYKKNRFPYTLTAITLGYETLFNITYMFSRTEANHTVTLDHTLLILAAVHGTFSLIMFVALLVFMILAWTRYRRGVNFFKMHPRFTATFIALWLLAITSGILFYIVDYVV